MSEPALRRLERGDMTAAAALQNAVYQPLYHEPHGVLESRVVAAPDFCWGAFRDGELVAYILSHPWPAANPPPIGVALPPPPPTDNWFVHDLAIGPVARGAGLGRLLVAAAAGAARTAGLVRADLVAVQGAWRFWEKLGYRIEAAMSPALRAKVAAYGDDARYMTARIEALHPRDL